MKKLGAIQRVAERTSRALHRLLPVGRRLTKPTAQAVCGDGGLGVSDTSGWKLPLRVARLSALVALVAASSTLHSAEPFVRTTLSTKGDIWVGQRVTVLVELLSPGFFSGTPVFDVPRVPGVILFKPDERPVLNTETVAGVSYAVQRHELAAFPQRPGQVTIPPFKVRFATREGAASPVEQRLTSEAVVFDAKPPPGTEGLSTLISARDLEAKESWQPEPGAAKVGEAFTRTITFAAPNVPAMLFPSLPAATVAGLGIYQKEPEVRDRTERGEQRGERIERITYICERPGQVRLPAMKLKWWDLDDRQLRTIEFPARVFDISPNPALASLGLEGPEPRDDAKMLRATIGFSVGVLLLAFVGWWMWSRGSDWWQCIVAFWRPIHLAPLNPTGTGGRPHALARATAQTFAGNHRSIQSDQSQTITRTNAGNKP